MNKLEKIQKWWNDWHEVEDVDFQWLIKQAKKVEIYEEVIDEVEYAMDKVGWNNSRVETAFGNLNEKLSDI